MLKNWNSWFVLFLAQFIGWKLIFKNENFVAFIYQKVTVSYNEIIYFFTSKIDFAIGEILYLLLVFSLIILIIKIIKLKTYTEKFSLVFKVLFFVLLIYNSLWGIVYYKKNFQINKSKLNIEVNGLKHLYNKELKSSKDVRKLISVSEKQPIEFIYNDELYRKDIQLNLAQLKNENWILNYNYPDQLVTKKSNFSSILSQLGILGYYNPFTIESNVNTKNSDLKTPFTISHELAHQFGFATESEANFIAYYLGVNSKNNEMKYAAHFKATFSILNAIYPQDSTFVKRELDNLPMGLKIDREAEIEYYKQFDGKLNEWFSILNNQFLKVNNQDGIISYSKYVELVYYYHFYQNKKG